MIVVCPNCNKKFNINENLIPRKGRLLQCSSCNHKWHYLIPLNDIEIEENVRISEKIENMPNNNNKKISTSHIIKENINKQKLDLKNKTSKKYNIVDKKINKKIYLGNILNNLIILIITFIAIILILDTFKNNIANYLPIIIPLLDNLYLSFYDLIAFVKDLFN